MTAEEVTHRRPGERQVGALTSLDSYGAVLVSIIVTYAMAVIVTGDQAKSLVLFTQIATVWLVFRVAHSRQSVRRATDALLLMAGLVAVLNALALTGDTPGAFLFAASCVLYFIAPVAIVRDIGTRRDVDLETVLGAVAAYLLIGMFFAFAYRWMGDVQSTPFFGPQGDGTLPDDLFFSFTTMTTIGFGSLVPADNPGQTFAVAEGVIGQLFLVVAVAKVVGAWQPKRMRDSALGD